MYEFDGYDEILKCYEGETDIHASTSFEVGLMNDLYYQLFYNYDSWQSGTRWIYFNLISVYNKYITKGNLNDLNTLRSYN